MAEKTIAERVYTAYLAGNEALFTSGGTTYTFTPEGLRDFITLVIDERLSEAQRTAIDNLEAGVSTAADIINALQTS